jgi:uncharacterized cupredoxin-like copper-binding protein
MSATQNPTDGFRSDAPGLTRTARFALLGGLALASLFIVALVAVVGGGRASGTATPAASANAPAATPAPAPAAKIEIGLKEFAVTPTPTVGRAGHVTFRVRNTGAIRHEFVVLRTNKRAGSLLKGSEASEKGHVGEIPDIAPRATKTLRLDLKPGHYALICNLPGHYKAGQYADFTVR